MARRKTNGNINKSQLMRDLIAQGVTSAKDIAARMQAQGLKVSMPQVYTTLARARKGSKPGRRGGRRGPRATASATAVSNGAGISLQDLTTLAELAKRAGGVTKLRAFLDSLANLA
jgi:hypothetical protein